MGAGGVEGGLSWLEAGAPLEAACDVSTPHWQNITTAAARDRYSGRAASRGPATTLHSTSVDIVLRPQPATTGTGNLSRPISPSITIAR